MNPISQFGEWFAEAKAHPAISEPTAMTLATADAGGMPAARIVLLKDFSADGFAFVTNYASAKSADLLANPQATLLFYWMPLNRQVRISGTVTKSAPEWSDAYFASRPRARQLGAWASQQSQTLESREALEQSFAAAEAKFAGQDVPRPPHWGGWLLKPRRIEFWQNDDARLHERHCFDASGTGWQHTLLYP